MSEFSNKSAMSEALNSLHRYIRSMYISVDLPEIATSALEVYFNCENTELQATFDKMIGAAAIQAIYEDKDIPQWLKARAAKRAAEELQDAFRGAKVEYEFAIGRFGVGQESVRKYERAKKEIKLCRKAAWLDKVKKNFPRQATKQLAKQGVKAVLTAGGLSVGGPIGAIIGFVTGLAVDAVWYLTPKSVKDKIKKKAGEIAQKSRVIINTVSKQIKTSPIVQKANEVVERYVAPYVRPVYEEAKKVLSKVASTVGNTTRKGCKIVKSLFA